MKCGCVHANQRIIVALAGMVSLYLGFTAKLRKLDATLYSTDKEMIRVPKSVYRSLLDELKRYKDEENVMKGKKQDLKEIASFVNEPLPSPLPNRRHQSPASPYKSPMGNESHGVHSLPAEESRLLITVIDPIVQPDLLASQSQLCNTMVGEPLGNQRHCSPAIPQIGMSRSLDHEYASTFP